MKIGIMADTHDNLPAIRAALRALSEEGVSHLLHAGDFVAPFAAKELINAGIPLTAVFGNNDGEKKGLKAVLSHVFEGPYAFNFDLLGGKRVVLVHDINAVPVDELRDASMVVCGHTHKAAIWQTGGALVVNPGEVCGWLSGKHTYVVLDADTMKADIREFSI